MRRRRRHRTAKPGSKHFVDARDVQRPVRIRGSRDDPQSPPADHPLADAGAGDDYFQVVARRRRVQSGLFMFLLALLAAYFARSVDEVSCQHRIPLSPWQAQLDMIAQQVGCRNDGILGNGDACLCPVGNGTDYGLPQTYSPAMSRMASGWKHLDTLDSQRGICDHRNIAPQGGWAQGPRAESTAHCRVSSTRFFGVWKRSTDFVTMRSALTYTKRRKNAKVSLLVRSTAPLPAAPPPANAEATAHGLQTNNTGTGKRRLWRRVLERVGQSIMDWLIPPASDTVITVTGKTHAADSSGHTGPSPASKASPEPKQPAPAPPSPDNSDDNEAQPSFHLNFVHLFTMAVPRFNVQESRNVDELASLLGSSSQTAGDKPGKRRTAAGVSESTLSVMKDLPLFLRNDDWHFLYIPVGAPVSTPDAETAADPIMFGWIFGSTQTDVGSASTGESPDEALDSLWDSVPAGMRVALRVGILPLRCAWAALQYAYGRAADWITQGPLRAQVLFDNHADVQTETFRPSIYNAHQESLWYGRTLSPTQMSFSGHLTQSDLQSTRLLAELQRSGDGDDGATAPVRRAGGDGKRQWSPHLAASSLFARSDNRPTTSVAPPSPNKPHRRTAIDLTGTGTVGYKKARSALRPAAELLVTRYRSVALSLRSPGHFPRSPTWKHSVVVHNTPVTGYQLYFYLNCFFSRNPSFWENPPFSSQSALGRFFSDTTSPLHTHSRSYPHRLRNSVGFVVWSASQLSVLWSVGTFVLVVVGTALVIGYGPFESQWMQVERELDEKVSQVLSRKRLRNPPTSTMDVVSEAASDADVIARFQIRRQIALRRKRRMLRKIGRANAEQSDADAPQKDHDDAVHDKASKGGRDDVKARGSAGSRGAAFGPADDQLDSEQSKIDAEMAALNTLVSQLDVRASQGGLSATVRAVLSKLSGGKSGASGGGVAAPEEKTEFSTPPSTSPPTASRAASASPHESEGHMDLTAVRSPDVGSPNARAQPTSHAHHSTRLLHAASARTPQLLFSPSSPDLEASPSDVPGSPVSPSGPSPDAAMTRNARAKARRQLGSMVGGAGDDAEPSVSPVRPPMPDESPSDAHAVPGSPGSPDALPAPTPAEMSTRQRRDAARRKLGSMLPGASVLGGTRHPAERDTEANESDDSDTLRSVTRLPHVRSRAHPQNAQSRDSVGVADQLFDVSVSDVHGTPDSSAVFSPPASIEGVARDATGGSEGISLPNSPISPLSPSLSSDELGSMLHIHRSTSATPSQTPGGETPLAAALSPDPLSPVMGSPRGEVRGANDGEIPPSPPTPGLSESVDDLLEGESSVNSSGSQAETPFQLPPTHATAHTDTSTSSHGVPDSTPPVHRSLREYYYAMHPEAGQAGGAVSTEQQQQRLFAYAPPLYEWSGGGEGSPVSDGGPQDGGIGSDQADESKQD